jgi:hypothetical protein
MLGDETVETLRQFVEYAKNLGPGDVPPRRAEEGSAVEEERTREGGG